MTNAMERRLLLLMLVVAGSSLGCQETRFLSCRPRDARVEAKTYELLHDPFPDESLGPDTFSRPRDFQDPRKDEFKDFDLRNRRAAGAALNPAVAVQPGMWDDTSRRYNVVPY